MPLRVLPAVFRNPLEPLACAHFISHILRHLLVLVQACKPRRALPESLTRSTVFVSYAPLG